MSRFSATLLAVLIPLSLAAVLPGQVTRPWRDRHFTSNQVVTPISPTVFSVAEDLNGHGLHLGKYTGRQVFLFNIVTGRFAGAGVEVAADGSTMSFTFEGVVNAQGSTGTFAITGGTRRFVGATGAGTFVSVDDFVESIGTVAY